MRRSAEIFRIKVRSAWCRRSVLYDAQDDQTVISVSVAEPAQVRTPQEADRYAADRLAFAAAAVKAKRLWPDVIGEVLADEIMALLDLPSWLRSQTRAQRLVDTILSITEPHQAHSAGSAG